LGLALLPPLCLFKRKPHFHGAFVNGLNRYRFLVPGTLQPQTNMACWVQSDNHSAELAAVAAYFVRAPLNRLV
jgi:hypothetical protein